jgi:hypothetical protein
MPGSPESTGSELYDSGEEPTPVEYVSPFRDPPGLVVDRSSGVFAAFQVDPGLVNDTDSFGAPEGMIEVTQIPEPPTA